MESKAGPIAELLVPVRKKIGRLRTARSSNRRGNHANNDMRPEKTRRAALQSELEVTDLCRESTVLCESRCYGLNGFSGAPNRDGSKRMVSNLKEFVAFISEAPTIEISGGVAHVQDRSGDVRVARAMSVRMLEKYGDRINRALSRYAGGETDIIVDD
jgi:hypothetical protein